MYSFNVFFVDTREWKKYNTFIANELLLLKKAEENDKSLVTFDDMGDKIRMQVVNNFYSSGRNHNINIKSVSHTITDLNVKARENTPLYIHYFKWLTFIL